MVESVVSLILNKKLISKRLHCVRPNYLYYKTRTNRGCTSFCYVKFASEVSPFSYK